MRGPGAREASGVVVIPSPGLFQAGRRQITALSRVNRLLLAAVWLLGLGMVGLIFSPAAHERRRQWESARPLWLTATVCPGRIRKEIPAAAARDPCSPAARAFRAEAAGFLIQA